MKLHVFCFFAWSTSCLAYGDGLPVITSQPTNQTVLINGTANFSVSATGATSYQWRFNGVDIPNATNATLQVANVQANLTGYYMVVAKNGTGYVPSRLAYLGAGGGTVPFSNFGVPTAQAIYRYGFGSGPITNGTAVVVAGPQIDQMVPVSDPSSVMNGYFDDFDWDVPTVAPGQTVYYRVEVTYPYNGSSVKQPSTVLKLVAGGGSTPVPDASGIRFPGWLEWPSDPYPTASTATNQIRLTGETVSFTNDFYAGGDYGIPTGQWRKDGVLLPNGTNFFQAPPVTYPGFGTFRAILTISNVQPSDAGVYDVQVLGNNWIIGPKTGLSVQTANGNGVLLSPRLTGSNFVADFQGIIGRNYAIQWSSNLTDWNALQTTSNATGTITFTNAPGNAARFYRTLLLP